MKEGNKHVMGNEGREGRKQTENEEEEEEDGRRSNGSLYSHFHFLFTHFVVLLDV